jgi:hypothetical protein
MESNLAILLFDLALMAPPLVVVLGVVLLAIPSRARHAADEKLMPHPA